MTPESSDRWSSGDAYEAYMGRWSRLVARAFLEWIRPNPQVQWLDVGCGTGALTSVICELCTPTSVIACDPSPAFVEHARAKIPDERASFVVAGADALPKRVGGFDMIVSGLALNFLPKPERALAAGLERLRPGGTMAAYVWDYAEGMQLLATFWEEAVAEDPAAAESDERTRFPLCRAAALESLFKEAGLERVQLSALEVPTEFATFEDYWAPFLRSTGPAPSYVATLTIVKRDALKERLRRRLVGGGDGSFRLQARALAVRGTAP
jgi:ubiquinone/menaquinone biosynthesis C-methylase UbiE